jgi:low temperature requirement protein LtrA
MVVTTAPAPAPASPWVATAPQNVTFVELFFDLVFVFAFTGITGLVREHLTLLGVAQGALVFWLVWWAWTQFTWSLNPADTTHAAVRNITLAAAAAAFFMAEAVPAAFGDGGLMFATAYAAVRLLGLGLQLKVANHDALRPAVRMFAGISLAGIIAVLAGGMVDSPARAWLWLLAIALDLLAAARAANGEWRLYAGHFSERHGLVVIIVLGESLVAAGLGLRIGGNEVSSHLIAGTAVLLICALWWLYFGCVKDWLEHGLDEAGRLNGAYGRDVYSLGHIPIVAGVVAIAVAIEEAVAHPNAPLHREVEAALAAGVTLYLLGIAYGIRRTRTVSPLPWLAAAFIAAGIVLFTHGRPPAVPLFATAVVLLALVAIAPKPESHRAATDTR